MFVVVEVTSNLLYRRMWVVVVVFYPIYPNIIHVVAKMVALGVLQTCHCIKY